MQHDPDFHEGLDPDGPSADDLDRFGDEYITCASCGERFYDQSELCPACGEAIEREDTGLPRWAIVTACVVLAAFAAYFIF